jgi:hypothetical protein
MIFLSIFGKQKCYLFSELRVPSPKGEINESLIYETQLRNR